jgi:1,2-diacylglycerol 3-alpha-glucosyltransferase
MNLNRIVFVHAYSLHYHIPRLQALSEECQKRGIDLINIEITNLNQAYELFYESRSTHFKNITLFPGQKFETLDWGRVWISLKTVLSELRPDVIFLYGYANSGFRRLKMWAKENSIATVLISDSNAYDKKRNLIFEFLKSLFVSQFEGAFVGGTDSRKYLQRLRMPSERIVEGYDVVDNHIYVKGAMQARDNLSRVKKKWNLPNDYFLFVGRLIEEKNLPRLLQAFNLYSNSLAGKSIPWSLVLCGSGPEQEKLRQMIDNFPGCCKERISIYGHIHPVELIDFYACASCLILPSVSETWGLVVNEAMACSLPVMVSTRVGCAADLVEHQINGWLFNPYKINELAQLMLFVSGTGLDKRAEMGLAGYERISKWDLDRFTNGSLEISRMALENMHRERKNDSF